MVENAPFWNRYPEKYSAKAGQSNFHTYGFLSPEHDEYIKEQYFDVVAAVYRFPRYVNKRVVDPQVQCFIDQNKITYEKQWDLPKPNPAAAFKSLAKYAKAEVLMQENQVKAMNKAWEWTIQQFYPYMGESRIVSCVEAVDRLDKQTSSGYPFNTLYSTKSELFAEDPDIIQWLEDDWNALLDPMWTTLFSSSLKEEIRPLEKIAKFNPNFRSRSY